MRYRVRALLPSLLFAAACSGPNTPNDPPDDPPDNPPGDPAPEQPGITDEQLAANLGIAIMARDGRGAPHLIRAIAPRPAVHNAGAGTNARDHLSALKALWVKTGSPMNLVEVGTQVLRNGATMVQLSQQVGDVPIDGGELRMLLHPDGAFAALSGAVRATVTAPVFTSSPRAVGGGAGDPHDGTARPAKAVRAGAPPGGGETLEVTGTADLTVEARTRRTLAQVDNQLKPAWEVEMIGQSAPDALAEVQTPVLSAYSYVIDDVNGDVLRKVNLEANDAFVYRVYAEATGNRRPLDGPLESFAPHPTGVPDGSAPGRISSSLVVMEAFNGSGDKWLADDATTTAGNNAEAFSDLDGNNVFSAGDVRPEVRSRRVLNYTYDQDLEPIGNPDQLKAGSVNAFFIVNWMHDWWYDSGFTEATRNGQLDNFGRGGIANDRLLIAAQAGATTGSRNNASMATPADGARPRMRMFLWTAGADGSLTGPNGPVTSDVFGAGPRTFTLTGELAIGTDATAPTDDGCQAITGVTGKIAVQTYAAQCNSSVTVANARAAGAAGVLLIDGELDIPRGFGGNAAANLPGLVVGKTNGQILKDLIAGGPVTVTLASTARGAERDGDLDATVVAHEWGHYMHHRLANCGNSQQCAGMSEGWGDFNALLLMLREGDNREGVYAVAPYAVADGTPDAAYFGIRRFPYSRDRTKNDTSFRHIDDANALPTTTPGFPGGVNSEVHNTGEIWTTMLWEVLNTLADAHGVTVARRRMTDYMVTGLLLAPTNATFTEQRDAILAGASALDTDDMLLMAGAFAGRGIGSCALSPPRASRTNSGVVESGTIAAKLAAGTPRITDDGARGDRDGVLESGESGTIRLTVVNGGPLAAEQVTLTATSSLAGVTIGKPTVLAALSPFSTIELTIPVTVAASVPNGTNVTLTLHVAADFTCDNAGITLTLPLQIGTTTVARSELDGITASTFETGAPVVRMAPAASLRELDAGVCILQDRP